MTPLILAGRIATSPLAFKVAEAIARAAMDRLSASREIGPGQPTVIPTASDRAIVAQQIAQEALQQPELQHLASTESPWRSRAHWSAVISGTAPFLAAFGWYLAPEYQEAVAGGLWACSSAIAAYLAHRARKATKPLAFFSR